MAFATRSLRIFCKLYSGNCRATYSTLPKPITEVNLIRASQKCNFSGQRNGPRITGSLTNIQSSTSRTSPLAQTLSEKNEQTDDTIKEEEEAKKQREQQWKMMKWTFVFFGVSMSMAGGIIVYELAKTVYDENGNIVEDEFSGQPLPYRIWKRFCREVTYYTKFVQEPSAEKLLPDPVRFPYVSPPYTLVLELTDLLVHPDWTYQTGWRFKKRPGVDHFLEAVVTAQFETVVYTAESGHTTYPILDSLDPQGYITFRLVRDSTKFLDGHHVKDLDALNRDLSKVIVVDWNSNSVKLHPENALKIPRWNGNDDDTTLYDLAAFLKAITATNVDDVREVLNYYRQFDDPLAAFRENQRKLLQQMQEDETHKAQMETVKPLTSRWSPSFLRSH